jgi:multidrug resistance efflux pump
MKTQLATQKNVVREAELEVKKLKAGPRVEVIEEAVQVVNARTAELALARTSQKGLIRLELELRSRKTQLRQAKAELEQADADVLMRRAALAKTVIRSPVTGTVVRVFFNVGEVVRKGEPILEVADDSKGRWVEGFVAEEDANVIREGQKAEVEIGIDSGYYVDAVVEQVGYSTSASGSRYRSFSETGDYGRPAPIWLRIGLPETNPRPRPGTSAHVLIRVR